MSQSSVSSMNWLHILDILFAGATLITFVQQATQNDEETPPSHSLKGSNRQSATANVLQLRSTLIESNDELIEHLLSASSVFAVHSVSNTKEF
jgi:hypothetical protein